MASTPQDAQDAISERRQWAATLYALANLVESGEVGGGDGSTIAMYDLDAGVRSEVPALSVALTDLADGVMDEAYDGECPDDDEGIEERAQVLYSLLDTKVPEIMDAIRIASMEESLRRDKRNRTDAEVEASMRERIERRERRDEAA